jgi:hypothetical protein
MRGLNEDEDEDEDEDVNEDEDAHANAHEEEDGRPFDPVRNSLWSSGWPDRRRRRTGWR